MPFSKQARFHTILDKKSIFTKDPLQQHQQQSPTTNEDVELLGKHLLGR